MFVVFMIIYLIAQFQSNLIDKAYENIEKGNIDVNVFSKIRAMSFMISTLIVLFNKFILGKVFHIIVDMEKISTKTKFNISFA